MDKKVLFVKSIRHFTLNKRRPIYANLHKNRKSKLYILVQVLKVMINTSTCFSTKFELPPHRRLGLAVTKNQSEALAQYCDLIVVFDRRALLRSDSVKTVLFTFSLAQYILALAKWHRLLFSRRYWKYFDLFCWLECLSNARINSLEQECKRPLYLSNINSPTILLLLLQCRFKRPLIHVPHSEIGNTVLPMSDLVDVYFCKSRSEYTRLSAKRRSGRLKLCHMSTADYRPSVSDKVMLVLAKNWYEIDWRQHDFGQFEIIGVKTHPANSFSQRVWIYMVFSWRYGYRKIKLLNKYNLDYQVACASSAAVFELIRSGKFIHFLALKEGVKDHYGFDDNLSEGSDTEEAWRSQVCRYLEFQGNLND